MALFGKEDSEDPLVELGATICAEFMLSVIQFLTKK